jgi:hypothetical protein
MPRGAIVRSFLVLAWLFSSANGVIAATLTQAAQAAWEKYVRLTEARVEADLRQETKVRPGSDVLIERLETKDEKGKTIEAPGAMVHHWKGSVFVPGVTLASVLRFVQDYDQHYRFFKEVEKSRLLSREGDTFRISYRLRRTKFIVTAYYQTEHTVRYRSLGPAQAASRSEATKIAELDAPGTRNEREKTPQEDRGFLWRLNSYWRFTERDGGVIAECESISLSRSIPTGLGWLIRGYVESVPRESLYNTLSSLSSGVRQNITKER